MVSCVPGQRARSALTGGRGRRFVDVRWIPSTGSTNADAISLARANAPEGIVIVADHQTAGRGRQGRTWEAPPASSLLVSVLLRPPAPVRDLCTMAVAVAAVDAIAEVAGLSCRLKWPNDLVWPGDGSERDRKLAGVLAEADGDAVVVGIGINVDWPEVLPDDLSLVATACNHVMGSAPDREDLLIALLQHLDLRYTPLVASNDRVPLLQAWRDRSATLGRRVRVELADGEEVVGTAVDVTDLGHLVVEDDLLMTQTVAAGDVIHLRPQA
jgi:BirA family biotin operon repressor/biotin-[acetyl-CoA-carboxylase] ligase